jgi:glycosyltransferase involved in cell wall biosynthesis
MGGGGAERQLAYLAGPLRAYGWDVHVALVSGGPNLPRLQAGGAVVHCLHTAGNYDPRLAWQLGRVIGRVKPALVQVWFVQMELVTGALAEMLRIPWVMSERSSELAYPPTLKNRLRIVMGRTADAIISNSWGGDAYWRSRAARVPRFVIPNALPFDEIDAARPSLPASCPAGPDDAVVLFAGRFGEEKNIAVLHESVREIVRRPRTIALLCGDGPLLAAARERVRADDIADRVFLPGYVDDLWPLMKRADVVVAVGRFEGRPNTVLEAMAAARSLVVSDIPAHREILDTESAAWANPRDPRSVAAAVIQVLENPSVAVRRVAVARARAAEWSLAGAAAQYDQAYRHVLARRGAPATARIDQVS